MGETIQIPIIFILELPFICITYYLLLTKLEKYRIKPPEGRIAEIDTVRGLAILFIVSIHASYLFNYEIIKDLLWVGLYFFVIISGFLLSLRYRKIGPAAYLSKLFFNIILVYALFSVIMSLIDKKTPLDIFLDILLGRANGNYYFIPLLVQLYVIYLVMRHSSFLMTKFSLVASLAISYLFQLQNFYTQVPEWNSNPLSLIFFGRFFAYFLFGTYISGIDFRKMPRMPMAIFLLGALGASLLAMKPYLTNASPIFLFLAAMNLDYGPIKGLAKALGSNSLVIYLIHTKIVYDILYPLSNALLIPDPLKYLFIVLLGLSLSLAAAMIFNHFYTRFLHRQNF